MFKYTPRNKNQSFGEPRTGTVTNEPEIQSFNNESERTVFELTGKSGKTITCVHWGIQNYSLEKGDTVTVFGFEKENNVFIVNKLYRNYEIKE